MREKIKSLLLRVGTLVPKKQPTGDRNVIKKTSCSFLPLEKKTSSPPSTKNVKSLPSNNFKKTPLSPPPPLTTTSSSLEKNTIPPRVPILLSSNVNLYANPSPYVPVNP